MRRHRRRRWRVDLHALTLVKRHVEGGQHSDALARAHLAGIADLAHGSVHAFHGFEQAGVAAGLFSTSRYIGGFAGSIASLALDIFLITFICLFFLCGSFGFSKKLKMSLIWFLAQQALSGDPRNDVDEN